MNVLKDGSIEMVANSGAVRRNPYREDGRDAILDLTRILAARNEIAGWPGYRKTPLVELTGLADRLSIADIFYKDEAGRFGLGSFKALGGAYAVLRVLQRVLEKAGVTVSGGAALASGRFSAHTRPVTVTCATDGNHGRSVAWGARTFGCRCVIFVHAGVSRARCDAIAAYGAEVRTVDGNYDDAVRFAAGEAARLGWHVVADTSSDGSEDAPRHVMQGYALIADEVCAQLPDGVLPTHVFVQGGVGGLAAATCAYFWERFGARAPRLIVCEPERANCLQLSAISGRPVPARGPLDTIMAGLACGEVSILAWQILKDGADAFVSIDDAAAAETMRMLARPPFGDPPVVAGESAVAGLASLILACGDAALRSTLELDAESIVLVIGTEGATDPAAYRQIVGIDFEQVVPA
jgi:diaminopropionate ammonia-lyase